MEEKPVFKVGDRIDQMCITCNEERGHIVVSLSKAGRSRASSVQCVRHVSCIAPGQHAVRPIKSARHMIARERIVKDRR
jgi:ribosomal protein S1